MSTAATPGDADTGTPDPGPDRTPTAPSRRDVLRAGAVLSAGAAVGVFSGTAGAAAEPGAATGLSATPSAAVVAAAHRKGLSISKEFFGRMPDGARVDRYTFGHGHGLRVRMITYGAAIQEILAPDRHGHVDDVVLGLRTLEQYRTESPYFGATIGRYANRIAKGTFTLDGVTYHIPLNNGPNALHGGPEGFNTKVWNATEVYGEDSIGVRFVYFSPNGQMGFPGNLTAAVTYTVNTRNELSINYVATTDRPTIVNLTNHSYFNLRGEGQGGVYDHVVTLNADRYTPTDTTQIPYGSIVPVAGTPFDFRKPHTIGARIRDGVQQILFAHGYDHNWVLNRPRHGLGLAARVHDPKTGRMLECWTDQIGVQFYTGNFLDGSFAGISGKAYRQGDAFTLETQHFPDSPNHKNFPSTVLRPGHEYNYSTVFTFSAR